MSKADSWASAIFVNELDTVPFESPPNNIKGRSARLTSSFQLLHCYNSNSRVVREILLAPSKGDRASVFLMRLNRFEGLDAIARRVDPRL